MRKILGIFALLVSAAMPLAAQTQSPIRVNCGGANYTDSKGQVWEADFGFNGGSTSVTNDPVANTADPVLFRTSRRWNGGPNLAYSFPVANGKYHVNLYFDEDRRFFARVGARVFSVKMEGAVVLSNIDIFAAAGADTALVESAAATVTNGVLDIEFVNVTQSARVNAIEVLPETAATGAPELKLRFTYPDGSPVAGSLVYNVTSSLLSFKGSSVLTDGQVSATLLSSPAALGISAQFQVNLSLVDGGGRTLWQLALVMNPAQVNLGAVQSSALNVVVLKP